jgi:hypothetical protein
MQELITYEVKKIEVISECINLLQNGTNLPVKNELSRFIQVEFEELKVSSLIMRYKNDVVGHTIFFDHQDILYFGFFNASHDNSEIIDYLIDCLIDIAKERKCNSIRGPINLPTLIYGWGFYESGDTTIAAGTPYSDPCYIDVFKKRGFMNWHRLLWFKIPIISINPTNQIDVRIADFENTDWVLPYIMLQEKLFPDSAKLTPGRTMRTFLENLAFIRQFGYKECIYHAYDQNKLVGLGYWTPNPFDLNEQGKTKSALMMGAATDPEYQNKGVLSEMFKYFGRDAVKNKINYGEWLVGDDNPICIHTASKSFGGKQNRSYQILNLKL